MAASGEMLEKMAEVWEAVAYEAPMAGGRTRPLQLRCELEKNGKTLRTSCVVKAVGHPEVATKQLAYELMGYKLATLFGCHTPSGYLVNVSQEFIDANDEVFTGLGFRPAAGTAFGSEFLDNLTQIIPNARRKDDQMDAAARAYALDMAIQNIDRRRGKPNCALDGANRLVLFDFEKAFTFCVPFLLGAPKPWEVGRFGFQSDHIFYSWLQGQPIDWTWVDGALATVQASMPAGEDFPEGWSEDLDQVAKHFGELATHAAEYRSGLAGSLI